MESLPDTGKQIQNNNKQWLICFACLAASLGLFALGANTNIIVLALLSLFIPPSFVYIRATMNIAQTLLFIALFGIAAYLISGIYTALIYICCIIPITFTAGYAIRKRLGFYYSVLATSVAALATLGILILCIYLIWGNTLTGMLEDSIEAKLMENPVLAKTYSYALQWAQSGSIPGLTELDIEAMLAIPTEEAVSSIMNQVSLWLSMYLPQICTMCVTLFGLLDYTIPRTIVLKSGGQAGDIPVFSMWNLPKYFGRWSIALLIVSYIGVFAGWNNFELVYSIVLGFMTVTYSIQGMALIDWLMKKKINSTVARVAILAVTFLLTMAINLYMWIGFFEQIMKIRRREAFRNA
jgi:hypothetical protein